MIVRLTNNKVLKMFSDEIIKTLGSEAHIWLFNPLDIVNPLHDNTYRGVLSKEETKRLDSFRFAEDKHTYLVAHVMLRFTLSRYAKVSPGSWRFKYTKYGRPEINYPELEFPLRFNLSHTEGLIACMVSKEVDCGVDVELIRKHVDILGVARQMFSADEVDDICGCSPSQQNKRFFEYWTLKESYIKGRGAGLSQSLNSFSLCLSETVRLETCNSGDDKALWQFYQEFPTSHHVLAAAIRRDMEGRDVKVVSRFFLPEW